MADPDFNPETVETLLETARDLLRAEDARSESFLTRGASLAGFAGLIASLGGGLGAPAIAKDLGALRWVAGFSLALGLLSLLATLGITVRWVLWPRSFETIATSELARYPNYEFVTQDRAMIQGRVLRGTVIAVAQMRERNNRRSQWLKAGYVALLAGIALVVVSASTIGYASL